LLHQQLNSSPRVPRVPRCHQAAAAQMHHPTGATVFSKRSSAHGGRDNAAVRLLGPGGHSFVSCQFIFSCFLML
jgi:hypothetical protein